MFLFSDCMPTARFQQTWKFVLYKQQLQKNAGIVTKVNNKKCINDCKVFFSLYLSVSLSLFISFCPHPLSIFFYLSFSAFLLFWLLACNVHQAVSYLFNLFLFDYWHHNINSKLLYCSVYSEYWYPRNSRLFNSSSLYAKTILFLLDKGIMWTQCSPTGYLKLHSIRLYHSISAILSPWLLASQEFK